MESLSQFLAHSVRVCTYKFDPAEAADAERSD